jgi:hypothetical protein
MFGSLYEEVVRSAAQVVARGILMMDAPTKLLGGWSEAVCRYSALIRMDCFPSLFRSCVEHHKQDVICYISPYTYPQAFLMAVSSVVR